MNPPDPRFSIVYGDYDTAGLIGSYSIPSYDLTALNILQGAALGVLGSPQEPVLNNLRGSGLGLSYGTPLVMAQLQQALEDFRTGDNSAFVPVAAVQADIVAHSMGGLIARNLVLQPGYLSPKTYGAGLIHKMITIDTPHLGSPLPTAFLADANWCVRWLIALQGDGQIALRTVTTQFGPFDGSVEDLQGAGDGMNLSGAIQTLTTSGGAPIPTAMIAGVEGFGNGPFVSKATLLKLICATNPLAQDLDPTSWNSVFTSAGDPTGNNDGVVGQFSQLGGLPVGPSMLFQGYIHTLGLTQLGFSPPTVLDPGAVPNMVIFLLNTSKLNGSYYRDLAP